MFINLANKIYAIYSNYKKDMCQSYNIFNYCNINDLNYSLLFFVHKSYVKSKYLIYKYFKIYSNVYINELDDILKILWQLFNWWIKNFQSFNLHVNLFTGCIIILEKYFII